MKIAVSAKGKTAESFMDERFGRCNYFVIFDDNTEQIENIVNPAATASGGEGPAAVQELAKNNVQTVITGRIGGNAQQTLQAAGIEIVIMDASSIQDAIDLFLKSKRKSIKFQCL